MIRLLQFLKNKRISLVYLPLALYFTGMSLGLLLPPELFITTNVNDKIEHVSSFFILTILVSLSNIVQSKYKILSQRPFFSSFLIIGLYSVSSELLQLFIPHRFCDYKDLAANFAGSGAAIAIFYPLLKDALKELNIGN